MKIVVFFLGSFLSTICLANSLDYELIEKNLSNYEKKLQVVKKSIDNSVFDDQEILLKLDFDTDNLVAFLQENFVFQPYVGLLRGVQGTLNSRSGNALDQAVLLAKLLGDAGLETRIVNGSLTDEQAMLLLSGIDRPSIPTNIGKDEAFENALTAFSNKVDASIDEMDWEKTETYSRYKSSIYTLEKLLKQNNIELNNVDVTHKLIEQTKDYFWVEYRLSALEEWSSAHPAFKKNSQVDVKAIEYFKSNVPEKYLHQVRIEAFIQQRVGDKFNTHALMKAWQKPAANLQNTLITYSNTPSNVNFESDLDVEKILNSSSYFIPIFNGIAAGDKVFDLQGRIIDSMGMTSQAGALFKTLGDKTLSAIDKIDDRKGGNSKMQLTAQWLQFTFIHPDGTEFVQKRYIYQAEDNETELQIKTKLFSEYSLLTNVGEQSLSYLANVYVEAVEAGLPLLKASARKLFHGENKTVFPDSIPQSYFDLLTQYYWMNSIPDLSEETIRFRETPNLLGFKKGYVDANKAYFAVDVISNKQNFYQKQEDKYYLATKEAFKQGVWDTSSEWLPAKFMKLEGTKVDTLKVTNAAINQNIELLVLKPDSQGKKAISKNFTQNSVTENRLLSDIDQGYLVIAPKQKPNDLSMSGWWRINTDTGETLGMTADGGGQEITEYLIEQVQTALMLVRAIGNLKKCQTDNSLNNYEKMCCLMEAHINNAVGLSFGSILGATIGTAGAAVFDIADYGAELATGSGITPSTNGSFCKNIGPISDF